MYKRQGEQWAPRVAEYLDLCDDEHSSLQEKFLHALIRKFGFQPWTLGVLVRGALSMQWLKPAKEFRSLIASAESLDALLAVKRRFSEFIVVHNRIEFVYDKCSRDSRWRLGHTTHKTGLCTHFYLPESDSRRCV